MVPSHSNLLSGTAEALDSFSTDTPLAPSLDSLQDTHGPSVHSQPYSLGARGPEEEDWKHKKSSVPRSKLRRFMAVVRGKNDLGALLEAVYIAHLLKDRHTHLVTSLLVHADNHSLAQATGLFNHIYTPGQKLKKIIQAEKVDILYTPSHDNYAQLCGGLSGSHIAITGFSRNIFTSYLGLHALGEAKLQDSLRKRGYDLRLEKTLPHIAGKLKLESPPRWLLHTDHYIWLSLFEENELNRFWPPVYAFAFDAPFGKSRLRGFSFCTGSK